MRYNELYSEEIAEFIEETIKEDGQIKINLIKREYGEENYGSN